MSQIRILGGPRTIIPGSINDLKLSKEGTAWQLLRNDLDFQVFESTHSSGNQFTIFIERDVSKIFVLTDPALLLVVVVVEIPFIVAIGYPASSTL